MGCTALHRLLSQSDYFFLQKLLKLYNIQYIIYIIQLTNHARAAEVGDASVVEVLLKEGADATVKI